MKNSRRSLNLWPTLILGCGFLLYVLADRGVVSYQSLAPWLVQGWSGAVLPNSAEELSASAIETISTELKSISNFSSRSRKQLQTLADELEGLQKENSKKIQRVSKLKSLYRKAAQKSENETDQIHDLKLNQRL